MFIKLLATNIVANNFLGLPSNFEIISIDFEYFSEVVSKSFCVKENKATSAPDTSAEQHNKRNNKTIPSKIEISNITL